MSKIEDRLEIVERQLGELMSLAPIAAARRQAEADRRTRESQAREVEIATDKAARDRADLIAHIDRDPLVAVTCPGDGTFVQIVVDFREDIWRWGLRSAEGHGFSDVGVLPSARRYRTSDWAKLLAMSPDLVRAVETGRLVVEVIATELVVADRKLTRGWWESKVRG